MQQKSCAAQKKRCRVEMDCIIAVAEKPSIADAIAKALASSPITTRSATAERTHEFQGRYEGRQCEFRVTSVLGHCFSLDFAEAYRDWDACDPAELWHAPVVSVPTSGGVLKNLRETASGGDALILFLDCDREGEAIAFQVIDVCGPQLRRGAAIRRAKFSSVTAEDIARAMRSLGEPDANLAEAVLARQGWTCAWAWLLRASRQNISWTSTLFRCAPFKHGPARHRRSAL